MLSLFLISLLRATSELRLPASIMWDFTLLSVIPPSCLWNQLHSAMCVKVIAGMHSRNTLRPLTYNIIHYLLTWCCCLCCQPPFEGSHPPKQHLGLTFLHWLPTTLPYVLVLSCSHYPFFTRLSFSPLPLPSGISPRFNNLNPNNELLFVSGFFCYWL